MSGTTKTKEMQITQNWEPWLYISAGLPSSSIAVMKLKENGFIGAGYYCYENNSGIISIVLIAYLVVDAQQSLQKVLQLISFHP